MKAVLTVLAVIVALYILRVPGVVAFVDGMKIPLFNATNYLIDISTHIRERHPFIYMSLFFVLFFLMRNR